MNRLARLLATGLYTGLSPVAPGTAGSLLGLAVLAALRRAGPLDPLAHGLALAVLFAAGVWASGRVEAEEAAAGRSRDPGCVNVDEILGMALSVWLLPASASPAWLAAGFLLFRLFDVWKPFPIGRLQALPGGWGIMLDDAAAGAAANLVLQALIRAV
jgi:phosphatidylglycerophosphatase A